MEDARNPGTRISDPWISLSLHPGYKPLMDSDYDIVIAGGGLAGLTAGVTAARLGRKTLVLTGDVIGGQLLSI